MSQKPGLPLEPWGSDSLQQLVDVSREKFLQINSIIQKMGLDPCTKNEWATVIIERTTDTFNSLIDEANAMQYRLVNDIEELLKKCSELCKLLRIQLPQYGSEDLTVTLCDEQKKLKEQVIELEAQVNIKKQKVDKLKKQQLDICKALGIAEKFIPECPLPTSEELDDFEKHIESLEEERFNRESYFLDIKQKILEIIQDLGVEPSLEIEKTICSQDDSVFQVTDHNMKWLEKYYLSLQTRQKDTKAEIESLRDRVRILWEMLSEDIKTCNDFLQTHTGCSLETLEAWKSEARRCDSLKKANIEKFVKDLRQELSQLWEKCHLTIQEREEFKDFHSDLYTEDLLSFHDIEIKKLEKYYEDNKELFTLLEKREQFWNKMIELEDRACAPNRFKNRGGTLLKEEKERNSIKKRIPELEERLFELAKNFEIRVGRSFLSWGETIYELIAKSYENYESERKIKLSSRKQKREQDTSGKSHPTPSKTGLTPSKTGLTPSKTGLTPAKLTFTLASTISGSRANLLTASRANLLTPDVTSSSKRKPLAPLFNSTKRTKGGYTPTPKLKLNDVTLRQRIRTSLERKKRLQKIRRISKIMEHKKTAGVSSDSVASDYDRFETEMSNKSACRSTTVFDPLPSSTSKLPSTPKSRKSPECKARAPSNFKAYFGSELNI